MSRWFAADGYRQAVQDPQADAAGAPGVAQPEGGHTGDPFVPVDLAQLMQVWGSESTVKALLDSFVLAVRDDLRALLPLLEEPDVAVLRAWHHRVAGAVSVLQYPPFFSEAGSVIVAGWPIGRLNVCVPTAWRLCAMQCDARTASRNRPRCCLSKSGSLPRGCLRISTSMCWHYF